MNGKSSKWKISLVTRFCVTPETGHITQCVLIAWCGLDACGYSYAVRLAVLIRFEHEKMVVERSRTSHVIAKGIVAANPLRHAVRSVNEALPNSSILFAFNKTSSCSGGVTAYVKIIKSVIEY